jgi:ATP-dependent Lon protease
MSKPKSKRPDASGNDTDGQAQDEQGGQGQQPSAPGDDSAPKRSPKKTGTKRAKGAPRGPEEAENRTKDPAAEAPLVKGPSAEPGPNGHLPDHANGADADMDEPATPSGDQPPGAADQPEPVMPSVGPVPSSIDLSQLFRGLARVGPEGSEKSKNDLASDEAIVVAVRGMVLYPGVVLPVVAGRPRSLRAIQAAVAKEAPLALLLQKEPEQTEPEPKDLHTLGTLAEILRYVTAPDGSHHVIVQGKQRFRVKSFVQTEPYLVAKIERIPEEEQSRGHKKQIEARQHHLRFQAAQALQLLPEPPEELQNAVQNAPNPEALTNLVATFMEMPAEEKQDILATLPLLERMEKVSAKLQHLIEVLSLSKELRQRTRGSMEKTQREYFLREQLKSIQAELGEGAAPELAELTANLDRAGMPPEVDKEVRRELKRLERMSEQSVEYGMLRTYLETMAELPWSKGTADQIDLKRARTILDEDHFGLEKVKERILEFLAVRKLKPDGKSPILCLVGPPGVGKTSLGMSIARAMGREFVRISLGGVHDESEIRGHRRTYVGALPGTIIQGMRRAASNNPVFMLDEMDKLGQGFHGDPSSALLEVLDPAQNKSFRDHYLAVPFDLSRVMFVATANVLDQIPRPLRDRCEVIELPGYTEEEKLEIAKRYIVKRQAEDNGLSVKRFKLQDAALREIVRSYTREAGCRELERKVGAVARRVATWIASGEKRSAVIGKADLEGILGPVRYEGELRSRTALPGVATGLAWTPVGGDILFIEATRMPGRGELILTGQLGDVMKESARAAISVVKSRLDELGLSASLFEGHDIHIHLPAGAIPKDGPSAGVALFTALVSLLSGRTVNPSVAMTGEISLRGLVLPVGGIKEKVLAAYRAQPQGLAGGAGWRPRQTRGGLLRGSRGCAQHHLWGRCIPQGQAPVSCQGSDALPGWGPEAKGQAKDPPPSAPGGS